ncbi:MAG TPA: alpha/beta hydrolase [Rhizobiales bacterium]|nr:alpha/beta hydrolase [Hyphomicrobiales bacterium]
MKALINWIISATGMLAFIYLLIVIAMYTYQRRLMYLPDTAPHTPAELGFSDVQTAIIPTPDGQKLQSWYLPAQPNQPTILFFHGNAGSIAGRANRMAFYRHQGYGAFFVSYRGYGGSTGSPDETGLVTDALAAYDWLVGKGLEGESIIVVGESLGAAVSVRLALQRKIRALVLEAPFTSTIDVAKDVYWWLPVNLLMKDRFETIKIIDQIDVPLLIIHGGADELTNVGQSKDLYAQAKQPKTLKILSGVSHNGLFDGDTWPLEKAFFSSLISPADAPNPA